VQQQAQQAALQAQQMGLPAPPPPQIPPDVQEMLALPAREDIEQVLRNDTMRGYRIDVESDSTIRADMTRNQNNMNQFLQGTAEYAKAMGPIVQLDMSMMPTVIEVYSAFARTYKLGKQAEDALDKLSDKGKQMAENPAPQKPDPKAQAEQAKADAEIKKAQLSMQAAQEKHSMEMEKMQAELEIEKQRLAMEREKLDMKRQSMEMDAAMQERTAQIQADQMERENIAQQRSETLAQEAADHKHSLGIEMMEFKAEQAKQPRVPAGDTFGAGSINAS
jgi:hypothetical protein